MGYFDDFNDIVEQGRIRDKTIKENVATKSNFSRGLASGWDQTVGMLSGAIGIAGDALGVDSVRDFGFEGYQNKMEEAGLNPLDVPSFTDIEGPEDAYDWFTGTLGQLAPSMGEAVISTIAGGGVAGLAAKKLAKDAIKDAVEIQVKNGVERSVANNIVKKNIFKLGYKKGATAGLVQGTAALEGGGMWGEDAAEHGVENANALSAFGLGQVSGVSELVSPGGLLIRRIAGIKGLSQVSDKVSDTFLKRLGTEVPKAMSGEAAQEVFQSFLGILNKKIQDPSVSLTDREAIFDYVNSGAAGAAGGVVFGGASAVFPEKTLEPESPVEHTVDDVLNDKAAKSAVASAVVNQQAQEAQPINMEGDTVGEMLRQEAPTEETPIEPPPAVDTLQEIQQPDSTDVGRLHKQLLEMSLELPLESEKKSTNPAWVKLKTLKDWEKETGEDIKSYVSSTSSIETLTAVLAGSPLTEKQYKVWEYLKSVAENKAMVGSQEVSGPFEDPGTGELPTEWESATSPEKEPGPLEPEPGTSLATQVEDAKVDAAEELFDSMVKILEDQDNIKDLDVAFEDMSAAFKTNSELEPLDLSWKMARDRVAKGLKNGSKLESGESNTDTSGTIQPDTAGVKVEEPNTSDTIQPTEESSDPLPEPSTEKHEVIDNPDSLAHGQEMNTAPSEDQKKAENYKVVHEKVDGLNISIENPAGTTRKGKSPDGKEWESKMLNDYGRILGTVGYDKDHVDVFFKAGYKGGNDTVHIINQVNGDGSFDEHKVVMGAATPEAAMALYNANYEKGWTGGKSVFSMHQEGFKKWLADEGPLLGEIPGSDVVSKQKGSPAPVDISSLPEIIPHTTKKGKIIKGIVRTDLTLAEAKAIDKYTFRKDGGFFIREKHLKAEGKSEIDGGLNETKQADKQATQESRVETEQQKSAETIPEGLQTENASRAENNLKEPNETKSKAQPAEDEKTTKTDAEVKTPLQEEVEKVKGEKPVPETLPSPAEDNTKPTEADKQPSDPQKDSKKEPQGNSDNDKFANNKLFTADAVKAARERLKAKRGSLNAGIDPELIQDMLTLGGAYFEAGVRGFADWSKAILDDVGKEFKPFLRGTYENLRYYPELDTEGMSTAAEIDSLRAEQKPKPRPESPSVELSSIMVTVKALLPDGETGEYQIPADAALKEIDEEIKLYKKIKRCVG